ncbi:LamG-like jellyroll fold domain-containing protein [Microbispora hainanensis]|nr:LamG-like jellyroll fold domain-containing protein [Microbispora hainanensis]
MAVLFAVMAFPGLMQLTVLPAMADPQPVTLALPVQSSRSAAGLPHLVKPETTQASEAGPVKAGGKGKRPKGALPVEERSVDGGEAIAPASVSRIADRVKKRSEPERRSWWETKRPASSPAPSPSASTSPASGASLRSGGRESGNSLAASSSALTAPMFVDGSPADKALVGTLTPLLIAYGTAPDGGVDYWFLLCDAPPETATNCWESGQQMENSWKVPSGRLQWDKQYYWQVYLINRVSTEISTSPVRTFTTGVREPSITSQLATPGVNGQEFHQLAGNYTTQWTDASVATAGPALSVVRWYNSLDPRSDGFFGTGWTSRWDMKIVSENAGTSLLVTYPDGRQLRFASKSGGTYEPPAGMYATLASVSGGGWRLMDKSATSYYFNAAGRLTKVTDNRGRSQDLTYGADGKLAAVTGVGGRKLTFTWNGSRVASVSTDPVNGAPLTWTYTYTGDNLTKVCAPTTECTSYAYDSGSQYRTRVLDSDPVGYWRLNEASGTSAKDLGWGGVAATYSSVTLGQAGALAGTADTAVSMTAGSVKLPGNVLARLSTQLSFETWFKTTTNGMVLSADSMVSGGLPNRPVIYVGTDGKLRAQFLERPEMGQPTPILPITSSTAVNNGAWHHVVLTVGGTSETLYLDGQVVGSQPGYQFDPWPATAAVGNGVMGSWAGSWPSAPTSATSSFPFKGSLDEVAVYDRPLTATEVQSHFAGGATQPGKLTKITLPSGRVWAENVYDAATDRIKTHTDDNGGTWTVGVPVYDKTTGMSTVTVTDPKSGTLTYVHDAWRGHRLVSETDQLSKTTSYAYDTGGFLAKVTDRNGNPLELTHDERGNALSLKTCRSPGNCQTQYTSYYLNTGDKFDPRNDEVTAFRDARSSSPTDNTYATTWQYTTYGEESKETTPATPDFPSGRSILTTYTDGTEPVVGGGTTPAGLVKSETDAKGNTTRYAYTAAGDVAESTGPTGLITRYDHDALGRTTSKTEISQANPSGVTTTITYDGVGRVRTTTGAAVKNEITDVSHTARVTYGYDPDGNTLTETATDLTGGDPERVITYTYDTYGNIETVTGPEGGKVTYEWDRTGAQTSLINELDTRFEYAYTSRGELASATIKAWTGSPVSPSPAADKVLISYAYDPEGRLASETDAMGRKISYTYYGDDLLSQVIGDDLKLNGSTTTRDVVLESYIYDAAGNAISEVSSGGKERTDSVYDAADRLTSETFDPSTLARKTSYVYDANDNVTRTTLSKNGDSRTEVREFVYNADDILTRQTVRNGAEDLTTTWEVDDRGLMTAVTDPRGNAPGADPAHFTTNYRYDQAGRLVESKAPQVQVDKNGATGAARPSTRYGYDSAGRRSHQMDAEGRTSTAAFDKAGRLTSVAYPAYAQPGGNTLTPKRSYAYDLAGRLTQYTDPRGYTTHAEYDQLDNLVRVTDPAPAGQTAGRWISEYDLLGEVLATVDPTGARRQTTYDDLGRQITSTVIDRKPFTAAYTTTFEYDDADNLVKSIAPGTKTTSYVPNAAGEITSVTDPNNNTTRYDYDLAGRTIKVTNPRGNATVAVFDLAGRQIEAKDLDDTGTTRRTAEFGYDPAGNRTRVTSAEGHITRMEFDASGMLTKSIEPVSDTETITTTFGYDATGLPTRTTDGRGNAVWTTYNSLGLVESLIEPATTAYPNASDRTWTSVYDAAGNTIADLLPGGVRIDRTYDHLGRLTKETGSGAAIPTPERNYGYDLAGRMTSISDYTLVYNDRTLLTTVTRSSTQIASFSYDALGNPLQRVDNSGTANFTWDNGDRLATAADPVSGRTFTYEYDKNDNLTSLSSANPAGSQVFDYDQLDRLITHVLKNSSGTQTAKITYGWDKDDNLVSKTTEGTAGAGTNTYGYDHLGRLTSWKASGGNTTTYVWDASGNRIQAGGKTYTYDERNRLVSGDGTTYTYTPRGTLASETKAGATRHLVFDAFDQMISDGDATYSYDALGRLVSRSKAGAEQKFTYSSLTNDIATVTDGSGGVKAKYGRDPLGNLLSLQEGTGPALGVMTDIHTDVVATYDGTALVDSTAYSPFGEVVAQTGTKRSVGYQSEWTDPDTGKVNMHARWYIPGTGGFASRDSWNLPPNPSSNLNRYVYGNGDPLGNNDPSGHVPVDRGGGGMSGSATRGGGTSSGSSGVAGGGSSKVANAMRNSMRQQEVARQNGGKTPKAKIKRSNRTVSNRSDLKEFSQQKQWDRQRTRTSNKKANNSPSKASKSSKPKTRKSTSRTSKSTKSRPKNSTPRASKPRTSTSKKPTSRPTTKKPSSTNSKPKSSSKSSSKPKSSSKSSSKPKSSSKSNNGKKSSSSPAKSTKSTKASTSGNSKAKSNSPVQIEVDTGAAGGGDVSGVDVTFGMSCRNLRNCSRDLVEDFFEDAVDDWVDDIVDDVIDDVTPDLPTDSPGMGGSDCLPSNSFVAGTKVLMADGSVKSIEDVKIGDEVIAADPEAGLTEAKRVTTLIAGEGLKHLVKITVDVDGHRGDATDSITATAGHPFWVPTLQRWVTAGQLQPGTWLQTSAGTYVQITAVERRSALQSVFNLTIEGLHTYYVLVGDQGILVHNDGVFDRFRKKPGSEPFVRPDANATVRDLLRYELPDYDPTGRDPISQQKKLDAEAMDDETLLKAVFEPKDGRVGHFRTLNGKSLDNGNHRAAELLERAEDDMFPDIDYDTEIYIEGHC